MFLTYLNVNLFAHIAYVLKPDWGELYPEQNSQGCLEGEISRGARLPGLSHRWWLCSSGGQSPGWSGGKENADLKGFRLSQSLFPGPASLLQVEDVFGILIWV